MFTILGYYKTPGFFGKFLMERKLHAIALRKTAILRYINVEISYLQFLKFTMISKQVLPMKFVRIA